MSNAAGLHRRLLLRRCARLGKTAPSHSPHVLQVPAVHIVEGVLILVVARHKADGGDRREACPQHENVPDGNLARKAPDETSLELAIIARLASMARRPPGRPAPPRTSEIRRRTIGMRDQPKSARSSGHGVSDVIAYLGTASNMASSSRFSSLALRVERGESIGEPQEVGPRSCSALSSARSALVRPPACSSMAAWTRSRVVASRSAARLSSETSTPARCPRRSSASAYLRGRVHVGEQQALERVGADRRFLLKPRRHGLRAVLSEELLRALSDREQAHDALLRLDHAAFPLGQLDAERLREAAHDVEDERESFGFAREDPSSSSSSSSAHLCVLVTLVARHRPAPRRSCSGASRETAP